LKTTVLGRFVTELSNLEFSELGQTRAARDPFQHINRRRTASWGFALQLHSSVRCCDVYQRTVQLL